MATDPVHDPIAVVHRNVGDEEGVVLAIGAPAVEDPGLDPHGLDEDESGGED